MSATFDNLPHPQFSYLWHADSKNTCIKMLLWSFKGQGLGTRPGPQWYCCSIAKSCPTLCDPVDCSTPGFPVLHYLRQCAQIHVHWVGDTICLILCHPLLLLPSIFPRIRVFSNELPLPIRRPKYWSFSISSSSENSGLISFRID